MKTSQQQVNLYQASFRITTVRFSAQQVLRISLFLLVLLAGLSLYSGSEMRSLQAHSNHIQQQVQTLQARIETLQQSSATENSLTRDNTIVEMKQTRNQKRRLLEGLGGQHEYQNRLFSSYFEGLARRTLDGLWLQEIDIAAGGQSIALTGNTRDAELLPLWIKSLKDEHAFTGVTFHTAQLTSVDREENSTDTTLQFSLRTHLPDVSPTK